MWESINITKVVIPLVLFVTAIEAARILAVFPTPSISHQVVFRPLTQELARRGHKVVVITPDPAFPKGETPANLTEIDVHDISYSEWHRSFMVNTAKGHKSDLDAQLILMLKLLKDIVEIQLQDKEVHKLLNDTSQKFDLLLIEDCVRPALALSHLYKVPVILMSSFGAFFGTYEIFGAPTHPLLYPSILQQKLNNRTVWDKISQVHKYYNTLNLINDAEKNENDMIRKYFGSDMPSWSELSNNVEMLFLNVHPIFEGNFPVPPNVIHIWGIHQKSEKQLPKDLKSYLDASKHGVIYMSFGTNVNPSLLPQEKINTFIKVFSRLPYDVLWKWDKEQLEGTSKNVKIGKWFPQSDLLRHPKIKLFITQGGLQSTDEAITAGVPLIGVPMLGDQWYNVEKYVTHKIGVRIDLETLTEDVLKNAIDNVIEDESYRSNIVRLRTLMSDEPQPPLERAVWWTEYVLRHGGARHLRSPAANMRWSEYLELELISYILLGLLSILSFLAYILYYTFLYFWKVNSSKNKIE